MTPDELNISNLNKFLWRCFEVNGCPGLYWHGKKACSKSTVASVSIFWFQKVDKCFHFLFPQAISALNQKNPKVKNIKIDSDGTEKVSVFFVDRPTKVKNTSRKKLESKPHPCYKLPLFLYTRGSCQCFGLAGIIYILQRLVFLNESLIKKCHINA